MNLQYSDITDISNTAEQSVTMFLHGEVGQSINQAGELTGVSGELFAKEMDFLVNVGGVKEIIVSINGPGGRMFDGFSIFSAIQENKSKAKIITRVVGVAASMLGVIAQAADKENREIVDFGIFMAHKPQLSSNPSEAEKAIIEVFQESIVTIFKNSTGLSEEEINQMINANGGDGTWLTAEEAEELGLFGKVINTGKEIELDTTSNNISQLYEIANNALNSVKPKTNIHMSNVNKILGLKNDASEDSTVSRINEILNEANTVQDLKNQISTLEAENNAYKEKEASLIKDRASELIENAVKEGKISEGAKESTLEMAQKDYDGVKNLLDSISIKPERVDLTNVIDRSKVDEAKGYNDYSPAELREIRDNSPELFEKLVNEYK